MPEKKRFRKQPTQYVIEIEVNEIPYTIAVYVCPITRRRLAQFVEVTPEQAVYTIIPIPEQLLVLPIVETLVCLLDSQFAAVLACPVEQATLIRSMRNPN